MRGRSAEEKKKRASGDEICKVSREWRTDKEQEKDIGRRKHIEGGERKIVVKENRGKKQERR